VSIYELIRSTIRRLAYIYVRASDESLKERDIVKAASSFALQAASSKSDD